MHILKPKFDHRSLGYEIVTLIAETSESVETSHLKDHLQNTF